MMHLIPSDALDFYKNLIGDDKIEEDFVTLDFKVE